MPPTDTCYSSVNDISGLTVNALSINSSGPYTIPGDGITLGAGGLSASVPSGTVEPAFVLNFPIVLGAPQAWTIGGGSTGASVQVSQASGTTDALTAHLPHSSGLDFFPGDTEVGAFSAAGSDSTQTGNNAILNGTLYIGDSLNGTDGNAVGLTDAALNVSANASVGALTSTGGEIELASAGSTNSGTGTILTVNGGATFDSKSATQIQIEGPGTTAGTDYSQLSATGAVSLNGALALFDVGTSTCPTLHVGDVDTLITTTGTLTGTFTGIPDGTIVQTSPCASGPTLRINYTGHSVTATVVALPPTVTKVKPDVGPTAGGTKVTITGTNFAAGATVNFGPNAGTSVTFVSSTQLTAVAPAGSAGSVDVTVTTSAGTSKTSSKDLYAYGAPTLGSFTPSSGITGSTVTVNGTAFAPGITVKFGTLNAGSVKVTSATQLKATVPNGDPGPSTITVSDSQGSETSATQFTPTLAITGFSPSSGAPGTTVTINGYGFTSTSTVKFHGISATPTFISSTELQANVPAGATTGPITVTNTTAPKGTVTSPSKFTVT